MALCFDNVISSVEIVNSQGIQVQVSTKYSSTLICCEHMTYIDVGCINSTMRVLILSLVIVLLSAKPILSVCVCVENKEQVVQPLITLSWACLSISPCYCMSVPLAGLPFQFYDIYDHSSYMLGGMDFQLSIILPLCSDNG